MRKLRLFIFVLIIVQLITAFNAVYGETLDSEDDSVDYQEDTVKAPAENHTEIKSGDNNSGKNKDISQKINSNVNLPADVVDTVYEKAVSLLTSNKLKIMKNSQNNVFGVNGSLSYTDFSNALMRILNLSSDHIFLLENMDSNEDMLVKSSDVDVVTKLAIMKNLSNKEITYGKALSCLLTALGYDPQVESKGSYPYGQLVVAGEIGLTKSVSLGLDQPLNRGNAALLLYNALNTKVMEKTSFGDKESYSAKNRLMEKYLNLYKGKGRITESILTTTTGSKSGRNKTVKIDETEFKTDSIEIEDYIGLYVEYYYVDEEDEKILVLVVPQELRIDKIILAPEDIISVSEHDNEIVVEYNDEQNNKKALKAPLAPTVFYNGIYDSAFSIDDFNIANGNCLFC